MVLFIAAAIADDRPVKTDNLVVTSVSQSSKGYIVKTKEATFLSDSNFQVGDTIQIK